MGASGTGPFENDGALDLCDELRDLDGEAVRDLLRLTLTTVAGFDEHEYLEKDEAEAAVAAAAIVAAGRRGDNETLQCCGLDVKVPTKLDDLVEVAVAALLRVMGQESELSNLWADTVYDDDWRVRVQANIDALQGPSRVAG
ncbi:DUF4259 domain-containing protein [Micromonospora sp. NPDC047738]|uniref:DUF4259 domain-containing protein n=1 Tax=Micromonospora sp. NPDC047738 TaxID=3155741 RepID=UPI0033CE6D77